MEITYRTLLDEGFRHQGTWDGMNHYEKNGFEIVDNNGYYRCDFTNMLGYGNIMETMLDLIGAYDAWARKRVRVLEQDIKNKQKEVDVLKESLIRNI